jgi:OMF family outer membrane factor
MPAPQQQAPNQPKLSIDEQPEPQTRITHLLRRAPVETFPPERGVSVTADSPAIVVPAAADSPEDSSPPESPPATPAPASADDALVQTPPNQPVAPGAADSVPPSPTAPAPTTPAQPPGGSGASVNQLTPFPYPSLPAPIPVPSIPTTPLPPVETPPQIGPAERGRAPESLNPNPNSLQFPTQAEEVRLRGLQPITLRQAIELAERNNQNLQVQLQTLNRTRATVEEAKAANYPTVGFQSNLTNGISAQAALNAAQQQRAAAEAAQQQPPQLLPSPPDPRASSSLSGNLSINYDLFTSGARPARIQAAIQQLRSDQLQVEITREQLRLDVANDYYNLQQADETVRINLAAVRNNEISLRDAQALEQAGLGTRFDVLRSEVQLANSRQDLTNAIAQQEIQRRQLAQRLNLPQTISVAAADPVGVAGQWQLSLEDSILLAYKNRAELEQLLAQRDLSEQQRKAALAAYGPTVTLNASYQFITSFNNGGGTRDGYSIGAGVNWNFFDGGAALARSRQQSANIQISETRFSDARNQIRFQVEQAYANLVSNLESIDTTTRALAQATEALRLARLRFQAGVGTQTDVINAETDLTRAEGNRVNAILGYNRALATLVRAISNFRIGDVSPLRP